MPQTGHSLTFPCLLCIVGHDYSMSCIPTVQTSLFVPTFNILPQCSVLLYLFDINHNCKCAVILKMSFRSRRGNNPFISVTRITASHGHDVDGLNLSIFDYFESTLGSAHGMSFSIKKAGICSKVLVNHCISMRWSRIKAGYICLLSSKALCPFWKICLWIVDGFWQVLAGPSRSM